MKSTSSKNSKTLFDFLKPVPKELKVNATLTTQQKTSTSIFALIQKNVNLWGHSVVRLVNSSDPDEMTLLSLGGQGAGEKKHTLIMKYVSVWKNEKNIPKQCNQWTPLMHNNKEVVIGREDDDYRGVRAVIGGSNNHLLFVTYFPANIDVFDVNTYQYVGNTRTTQMPKKDNGFAENGLAMNNDNNNNNKKRKSELLLFCQNTGLSIEFDEQANRFTFHDLSVAKDIEAFNNYAYVCFNDVALFFSGWDDTSKKATDKVHKYLITDDTWVTFKNTLPFPSYSCVATMSPDNRCIHIIGGVNASKKKVTTKHMRIFVSEWLEDEKYEMLSIEGTDERNGEKEGEGGGEGGGEGEEERGSEDRSENKSRGRSEWKLLTDEREYKQQSVQSEQEQEYDEEQDYIFKENDRIAKENDHIAKEKDRIAKENNRIAKENDRIAKEKDRIAKEKDRIAKEEEARIAKEKNRIVEEKEKKTKKTSPTQSKSFNGMIAQNLNCGCKPKANGRLISDLVTSMQFALPLIRISCFNLW
ncbi:hypothetical protein RFI_11947, partial [Reticulomyxa filosa]